MLLSMDPRGGTPPVATEGEIRPSVVQWELAEAAVPHQGLRNAGQGGTLVALSVAVDETVLVDCDNRTYSRAGVRMLA